MNHVLPSFARVETTRRAVLAAPLYAHPAGALPPADRYFGRVLMSIPEVRYWLRDLTSRIDSHPADASQVFNEAVFIEDALRDWAQKSPADSFLPNYIHCLAELYREIDNEDARSRRAETLDWLASFMTVRYAQVRSA